MDASAQRLLRDRRTDETAAQRDRRTVHQLWVMEVPVRRTTVRTVQRQYEFRVSGRLSEDAQHAVSDFSEMRIESAPPETILYGLVIDQAHLRGILSFLDSLGLQIVSVHQLPGASNADS
jgi:hypothetical protein